jgi:hypothetical protein
VPSKRFRYLARAASGIPPETPACGCKSGPSAGLCYAYGGLSPFIFDPDLFSYGIDLIDRNIYK